MISTSTRRHLGVLVVSALFAHAAWAAEESRPRTDTTKSGTSARPAAGRSTGKGPLPDPVLLDGSNQPAEKKSETGMIGDFELPGDENVRNGKVGGPQNPNAQPQGGGLSVSIPNPLGLPQMGGGQGGSTGGQPPPVGAQQQGGAAGGGPQEGGPQNPNAAGNPIPGGGDPGAQPQGTQVAELGGGAAGDQQGAGASGTGEKPKPVAIGDSAMRIPAGQSAAGVVGAQQIPAGHTQQHEKGTGSGGKGAGGAGGGNRVEKGRTIPSGL